MSILEVFSACLKFPLASHARRASAALGILGALAGCTSRGAQERPGQPPTGTGPARDDRSPQTLAEGQRIFRYDAFGDEQFWTDTARMHQVIQKSVSPKMALSVGLKVDADAIPPDVAQAIKSGQVELECPATSVTLL
jgi:hypothetical protein